MHRLHRPFFVALAMPLVVSAMAVAADTNWTGAVGSAWSTAGNWSAGVPTALDNAFLPSPLAPNPTIALPAAAVANRLTVSGSGYALTSGSLSLSDNFYVDSASAALEIATGAAVTSPNATIGVSSGNAGNLLTVNGRLTVPTTLNVGFDGIGNRLGVMLSGSMSAGNLWLGGVASSASNTVTVLAGGRVAATASLLVGYGGDANRIEASGIVTSPNTVLGYDPGADGNVAAVSAGGLWTNAGPLTVGRSGSGNSFQITSGTLTVTGIANDVVVGESATAGSNGIVVVGGSFSSQAALVIGKSGAGNMFSATGGAKVSNANARFGLDATSTGNAGTVAGAGTVWTITNKLRVGSAGGGNSLAITGGGVVNVASDVFVGGTSTGSDVSGNSITVSGSGSKLAILSGTADLVIAYGTGTANVVTVADGGDLAVSSVKLGPGGTLKVGAGAAPGSITPAATIDSPFGGDLVLDHSSSGYTLANPITGQTRVTQQGPGRTILTGSSSYSGPTTITAGTLAMSAATNNIASSKTIDVAAAGVLDVTGVTGGFALAAAQTLAGTGAVAGGMTTLATSTVAPAGANLGTLSFGSGLGLAGTLAIDVSGTATDRAAVAGGLVLDPASIVSFTVGSPLTLPAYVFASYGSLAGTFGSVTGLPTGYTIDYHYLGGNQIALTAVPEPGAVMLAVAGLTLSAAAGLRSRRRSRRR